MSDSVRKGDSNPPTRADQFVAWRRRTSALRRPCGLLESASAPERLFAIGRDASATLDAARSAAGNGFQNEGDNEITGIHVSDGSPKIQGILGAQEPHPFQGGWRVFYTQQHGDKVTWEILPGPNFSE